MVQAASRLENILNEVPGHLLRFTEQRSSFKTAPNKWSKKEILGHLIDSASNNHQRFVRLQIDSNISLPNYEQDNWVSLQKYQEGNWIDLVKFWMIYNKHLLNVLKQVDASKLQNTATIDGRSISLQFFIDDYVDHLEHHLKALLA